MSLQTSTESRPVDSFSRIGQVQVDVLGYSGLADDAPARGVAVLN